MIEDAPAAAALFAGVAAVVTALGAAMVKIIRELEKLTNGKMTRIGDSLARIEKIEAKNSRILGALHREIRAMRPKSHSGVLRNAAASGEMHGQKKPKRNAADSGSNTSRL